MDEKNSSSRSSGTSGGRSSNPAAVSRSGVSTVSPGRIQDATATKPGEMVDEPEEAVVPDERLEHQRRETSALALVRIQVSRQCVVVERARDGRAGLTGVLGCQRQYGYDPSSVGLQYLAIGANPASRPPVTPCKGTVSLRTAPIRGVPRRVTPWSPTADKPIKGAHQ